jgi:hypothetical protein
MTKRLSLRRLASFVGVAGILVARPAHAAFSGKQLLGKLAGGTIENVLGNGATNVLTNLGVFDVLGLGSGTDPVLDAKLDQIIMQLQVVQTDITDLKTDVDTLTNTVVAADKMVQLQSLVHDMDDAQTRIMACAQQVALVSQAHGTDATDQQMQDFALQMVGREDGPCDLSAQFSIIHDRIVTDQTLGAAESAFYSLLAQVAYDNQIEFERIASHFIQYSITQRTALDLIRGAYTALGEADNLQTVFTMAPSNFLAKLKDEEIAFLQGADAYITAGSPPYDTSPAALADAIVQRLEGVQSEVTSYSLSIRDDAAGFAPTFSAPGTDATRTSVAMADVITGAVTSYYGMANTPLTIGVGSCLAMPPTDGFSYVRPMPTSRNGFKMGSSCTVHIERHLARDLPATAADDWLIQGRYAGAPPTNGLSYRNAATLADEVQADALALAGDPSGRNSGASAFTVVPDAADPSAIGLAINLSGSATSIHVGTTHPFVAGGAGALASFTRVPFGPPYPDRYALAIGGMYLSIGSDGYAAPAATPQWFDFERQPDGTVELVYDGGVVYVDAQYVQAFHGESPDDVWASSPNLAVGNAAVVQWAVPADNVPRTAPSTALVINSPCLTSQGAPATASYSLGIGESFPSSECSDNGLPYVEYILTLYNQDSAARAFKVALAGEASLGPSQTVAEAGLHCFAPDIGSPDDHFDTNEAVVSMTSTTASTTVQMFDPTNRTLTVPANGSFEMDCQILDARAATPAQITLNQFIVTPCKGTAGGTCGSYP